MAVFNPQRLGLARRRRGMTKIQLAGEVGVSSRMIIAYERGEKEPSAGTLAKVAAALSFPVSFFAGPDLDEPPLQASSFRALSSLTARQRDQGMSSAAIALSLSSWIDTRFSLPEPNTPQHRGIDPETAAMAIRNEWGLGQRPIPNMIHLLEAHGVRVFSLVEECRDLDAFSFWLRQVPFVFLNTVKSAERSRMDAAHELGHLVLHWRDGSHGREAEREADLFGSAFLMPSESILAQAPRGGRLEDILQAKRRWNVSAANLTHRMFKLGLLSSWQYRSLFIELSREGYRRTEHHGSRPESSQILAKVFDALRNEGMTRAQVAEELNIAVDELDKVVFGLVLVPLEGSLNSAESSPRSKPDLQLV